MVSSDDIKAMEQSLERFKGYLAQDPTNENLIGQVSDLYLRLGKFDDASAMLKEAIEKNPQAYGFRFSLSNVALARGDFDEAESIINALINEGVDAPAIRFNLAYAMAFKGDYESARNTLEAIPEGSVDQAPKRTLLLGRMYHHLGQMDEGFKSVESYLSNNPQDAEGQGALALMYLDVEDTKHARDAARVALGLDENQHEALITMGTLSLGDQEIERAQQHFDKAISHRPTSGRAWSGKGLVSMLKLDLPGAISDLKKAVEHMPNHIGTWHSLAWCQILTDDIAAAETSFNKSLEVDDRFGETYGGLAIIAILKGETENVEGLIKRAIRLDPMSFSARFAQSLLAQQKGDPEKAKAIIQNMFTALNQIEGVDFTGMLHKVMKFSQLKP